jgi:uncharacterized membrane protein YadS
VSGPAALAHGKAGAWTGAVLAAVLAVLARFLKGQVYGLDLPGGVPGKVLEYPLWAAVAGLAANFALKRLNLHERLRPGFRTELFLKTGLVLMGAGISLKVIATAAAGALIQGVVMVTAVYAFSWWLSGRFGLAHTLRAVMSTAVSVCGVSAAIAAAGAVLAKKEEVTYVTALVIVTALPLMVITPVIAGALGMPDAVAGAWFGGNIDTTAAVVGAGTIYGETAQKIAGVVKQTQNALIGVVAFLLALYFTTVVEGKKERPSLRLLWERFPKFVLGFILASVLFTAGVFGDGRSDPSRTIAALKDWSFCLAFVCMGLELSVAEFRKMGWAPVAVFLIVTAFNTLLALGVSWTIFGYLFPA